MSSRLPCLPKTSDSSCKELGSKYIVREKSSHKANLISAINSSLGFCKTTLRFDNLLEYSQNSWLYSLQVKDTLKLAKRREVQGRVWEDSKCEVSFVLRDLLLFWPQWVAKAWSTADLRSSPELWCPQFLLRLHYIGMIDWLIIHVVELNLQPLPSPDVRLIPNGPKPPP